MFTVVSYRLRDHRRFLSQTSYANISIDIPQCSSLLPSATMTDCNRRSKTPEPPDLDLSEESHQLASARHAGAVLPGLTLASVPVVPLLPRYLFIVLLPCPLTLTHLYRVLLDGSAAIGMMSTVTVDLQWEVNTRYSHRLYGLA
jgi:hypothetical protein